MSDIAHIGPAKISDRQLADALRPPAEMRALAAAIGPAAALRLVEHYGGVRIEVPTRARRGSKLAAAIGFEPLCRLVEAYPRCKLNVPLCRHWRVRVLRVRDGLSYAEIARALGVVEATVYRHLAAADLLDQQRLPGL